MVVCSMAERTLAQNVAQAIEDFKSIKDVLNSQGEGIVTVPDGTPTSQYAELVDTATYNQYRVGVSVGYEEGYNVGVEEGKTEGEDYNDGYEAGRQAEYDAFWDKLQNYGKPLTMWGGFAYNMWNDETFKPKYPIYPTTTCSYLFYASCFTECNVDINFTLVSAVGNFCYNNSYIKKIKKIILKNDGSQTFPNAFVNATALEDLTIEGIIGNDINFSTCPLNKNSLTSILNALKDYSGTTTTRTLTLHADAKARLSETEIAIATQKGWTIA